MEECIAHKPEPGNPTIESWDQLKFPQPAFSCHGLVVFATESQRVIRSPLEHPSALLLPSPSLFIFSLLNNQTRTKEQTAIENQGSEDCPCSLSSAKKDVEGGSRPCACVLHDPS